MNEDEFTLSQATLFLLLQKINEVQEDLRIILDNEETKLREEKATASSKFRNMRTKLR